MAAYYASEVPAGIPAAFVQQAGVQYYTGASTSLAIQPSAGVQQGHTLFAAIKTSAAATVSSVTDTQGNSWAVDLGVNPGSSANMVLARAFIDHALTTSDTITVNLGASVGGDLVQLLEFAGLSRSPLDQSATADAINTSLSVGPTGTITRSPELFLTCCARGGNPSAVTWTPPSSYTELPTGLAGSGNEDMIDSAYRIFFGGLSTQTVVWAQTTTPVNMAGLIATYKLAVYK